ncbi:hypothetical protein BDQ17DRAFT_633569 [Cyathus striatus]|nr:hypothetical protein BDQ17DRAFT_633569 [Cyathus striatus]
MSYIFPITFKSLQLDKNNITISKLIVLLRIFSDDYTPSQNRFTLFLNDEEKKMLVSITVDIKTITYIQDISKHLLEFLSNSPWYTSSIYITPEYYAEIFTMIISNRTVPHYMFTEILETWSKKLHVINPAITLPLLQNLESTARYLCDNDQNNKLLSHKAEEHLLSWLKVSTFEKPKKYLMMSQKLPNPPLNVINAWQMAFEKAKRATLDKVDGYDTYFCHSYVLCPTMTCHDSSDIYYPLLS